MTRTTLKPLFTWRSAIVDADLPASAKHTALVLSLHMSERGDSAFPSLLTLARETSLGKSTISRSLNLLEELGYLTRIRGGGLGHPTKYQATFPKLSHHETVPQEDSPTEKPEVSHGGTGGRTTEDVKQKPLPPPANEPFGNGYNPTPQQYAWDVFEVEYGKAPPKGTREHGKWLAAIAEAVKWQADDVGDHRFTRKEFAWRRTTYAEREWEDTGPLAVMSNWSAVATWPERRRRARA